MKHTTKLITVLTLGGLLAVATASAQERPARQPRPGGPPPREGQGGPRVDAAKERMAKMAEELNLTEEQKKKIQEFTKSQAEKRQELRDATPEERQAKAKELRSEFEAKMKEILTPEQFAKWEKSRPQPGQRPGGPGGPGGEGRPVRDHKPTDKP